MPSKKKTRLLFEVPAETAPGAQSGWVYRSETDSPETPHSDSGAEPADSDIFSMSAEAAALSMAAMAQIFALSVSLAAIPLSIALRALGAVAERRDGIK
jgi:hypothetical protein